MTCREKMKIEHPECVGSCYTGGCEGCPSDYGYLGDPDYCANRNHRGFLEHKCDICWDREIPDYEDRKTLKDILSGMESEERYEGKSVCEMLEENRDLKKQLEEKDEMISKLKSANRGYRTSNAMYRLMYNRLETRLDNLGKIMSEMERKLEDSKE